MTDEATPHRPTIERLPKREDPQRVPRAVDGQPGLFVVDGTWGTITPLELDGGVRTVGERELIEHLEAGDQLVDTRLPEYLEHGTIPGAVNIPHGDIVERHGELDRGRPAVLFCNGPQCGATPDAIEQLLAAGYPADQLRFYRGGIHDWMTLGLPLD